MPPGWVSGRQARSKSVSVPGLIWRVVIQTKCSSIMASCDPARPPVGADADGGPFQRLLTVCPDRDGRWRRLIPTTIRLAVVAVGRRRPPAGRPPGSGRAEGRLGVPDEGGPARSWETRPT